ncbi:chromosome partition protein [Liquorilactobacillus aquaticus DSM 21051]|uniref:Chromosome partition protein Smc n=1 Tax=Liquorilactobacillus aquaticus DSM 21051 TaxID=1423725 RepID=A0A0R2CY11_9LACO|nr:chromosome segregation protein SMC [Liquorilactobacillus aquaticus]KRM96560.1 chromosome partition protein [Liquorilactobacillus aquaticus DSM 21051]
MKLKSLVINGFKSFADRTEIDFQPGMTAIVGPNGSGKSNIIEAIRWVLGEQSAKSLRGDKMPDVIFAGSNDRVALNRAEVLITFDNSDHYLNMQTEEVTITRKIYRDGSSEFLINGQQVRLKDIVNLFMDTGLGRESFSIISQGRVEAVFNSKPQERRLIIEEVAGVSKYKKEKQKAELELAETKEHLERVADIIDELKKQREPLKEQSSIAKDYLSQKKIFDQYNINRLVLEIKINKKDCTKVQNELEKLNEQIDIRKTKLKKQQKKVNDLHTKEQCLNKRIDRIQERLVKITKESERLSGQKNMSQQEHKFQETRYKELIQQKTENQANLAVIKSKKAELITDIKDLESTLKHWRAKISDLTKKANINEAAVEGNIEDLRSAIIEKMQVQTTLRNKAAYLEKEEKKRTSSKKIVNQRIDQIQQKISDLKKEQKQIKNDFTHLREYIATLTKQINENQNQLNETKEKSDTHKQQWYKALEIFQKARAQYEGLKNITANYAGYYLGVKEVLKARAQLKGIAGPVVEILKVPTEIAHAIEVVLGGQLQNIVVTDEQAAKRAISFLTKNKLGRVTFLPRTTVRRHFISVSQRQALSGMTGVLGVANQLVKCNNEEDLPILDYLLGMTVVVEKMDNAIQVERVLGHSVRIVTLAGSIINLGGSMTGGSSKQHRIGLLEQKQRVTQLAENIKRMQEKMSDLELKGANLQKKKEEDEILLATENKELKEKQKQFEELKSKLIIIQNDLKYQEEQLEIYQTEFESSNFESQNFTADQNTLKKESAKISQELEKMRQEYDEQKKGLTNLTQLHKLNEQRLREAQQKFAVIKERSRAKAIQLDEADEQIEQLEKLNVKAQTMLSEIKREQSLRQLKGSDIASKVKVYEEESAEARSELEKEQLQREEIHEQAAKAESDLERLNQLQEVVFDEKRRQSVKFSRLNTLLDHSLVELTDKYHLTYEKASAGIIDNDLEQVQHKLKLLKLGISELGNVNLGSIDEYERVNKRYEFLATQQEDLMSAKEQLQKSMFEMDDEVKTRFGRTFKEVAAEFSRIFPQIFGGGRATLKLTTPEDLLTTGIEIMAQPQGKNLQQLSLLSGGERALTAITLLFAILKVKPVPFVILDEAEAALDDANVERYSHYLHTFHDRTQFIVITHRKGTMEHSDVLYGITMQESGVSNTVSVSLENI